MLSKVEEDIVSIIDNVGVLLSKLFKSSWERVWFSHEAGGAFLVIAKSGILELYVSMNFEYYWCADVCHLIDTWVEEVRSEGVWHFKDLVKPVYLFVELAVIKQFECL